MRVLRIFFSKTGEAAYISHLDLQRVMARALRRSGMPVWWSQGFNPHIYMSFALPLPLGQQSLCEAVDVKTVDDDFDPAAYVAPLNAALPRGIEVSRIAAPVHPAGEIVAAGYRIEFSDAEVAKRAVTHYNNAETAVVVRKTKRSQTDFNLKSVLPVIKEPRGGTIEDLQLPAGDKMYVNPHLVIGYFGEQLDMGDMINSALTVTRMYVLTGGGEIFS